MDFGDEEKTAGEILRSLLLTSKMDHHIKPEVNNWQHLETKLNVGNCQPQQHTVWQVEPNETEKQHFISENSNLIQHIPITYVATEDKNLTLTNTKTSIKPFTYILNHNFISEVPKYCTVDGKEANIIFSDPQKIVFIQEMNTNSKDISNFEKSLFIQEKELSSEIKKIKYENTTSYTHSETSNFSSNIIALKNDTEKHENVMPEKQAKKRISSSKKHKRENLVLQMNNKSQKEAGSLNRAKVGRKVTSGRKAFKKLKNTILKRNMKTGGKAPMKKTVKEEEHDTLNDKIDGEGTDKNLFELTKLENNVNQVAERLQIGCDCADGKCFEGLNPDKVFKHRLNIADLTKAEHDMYLMGVIMASVQNLEETCRHKERIRIRSCYAYQGKKVCLTAFLYLQHVTLYQMKRLRSHLKNHGVSPRIHGNRGRKPANTFSLDTYHCATNFIQSYIEKHCVKSIPNFTTFSFSKGGVNSLSSSNHPNSKHTKKYNKVKIANKITSYHLPSECTKKIVHKEYKSFCESLKPSQKAMKYSTFTSFLQKQFPNVKFNKVEKRQTEKCGPTDLDKTSDDEKGRGKDKSEDDDASAARQAQTPSVLYIPAKAVQMAQPSALMVTPKHNHQISGSPQIVLNGKHLHLFNGKSVNDLQMDLRFPNRILIGNQIYGTQCIGQASGSAQQIYAADSVA